MRPGRCAGGRAGGSGVVASTAGEGCQGSSRLTLCPAGDVRSPRSPNRRTQSSSSPRSCENLRSGNGPHRIARESSDSGHAMRPTAQPLTPSRLMTLVACLKTRSEARVRHVERGQGSLRPTKRGVKPRPGSSSWRPARRRTGRVATPRTHLRPMTAPTFRHRPRSCHIAAGRERGAGIADPATSAQDRRIGDALIVRTARVLGPAEAGHAGASGRGHADVCARPRG